MEKKSILHFFKKNISTLITSVITLLLIGFMVDRFFFKEKKATAKEFIAAKRLFEKNESLSCEKIENGQYLLKKYPQLICQYQGALSLALAQNENFKEASELQKEHITRIEHLFPAVYKEFAEIESLIREDLIDESLQKSLALEERIKGAQEFERLRLLNLVRIAFLAHEKKQEALQNETLLKLQDSPHYSYIESLFSEENFNLTTYLLLPS